MRRLSADNYKKLVPLKRLAEVSSYSFGYVSILVQRKKLKAKKIGNKYYSTQEWFDQYLELHARDEKRLLPAARGLWFDQVSEQSASEAMASASLKNRIDNLVERALKDKLAESAGAAKIILPESSTNETSRAQSNRETQINLDSSRRLPSTPIGGGNDKIKAARNDGITGSASARPPDRRAKKNLAEILNEKIAPAKGGLVADLVEPEKKLAADWSSQFKQEEKNLKASAREAVKKLWIINGYARSGVATTGQARNDKKGALKSFWITAFPRLRSGQVAGTSPNGLSSGRMTKGIVEMAKTGKLLAMTVGRMITSRIKLFVMMWMKLVAKLPAYFEKINCRLGHCQKIIRRRPLTFKTSLACAAVYLAIFSFTNLAPLAAAGLSFKLERGLSETAGRIKELAAKTVHSEYLARLGQPFKEIGKLTGRAEVVIPGKALSSKVKISLTDKLVELVGRAEAVSLKLENNLKRRNQILARRLAAVKEQIFFITDFWGGRLVEPAANIKLAARFLPARTVELGNQTIMALREFLKPEIGNENIEQTSPYLPVRPAGLLAKERGKVAGAAEVSMGASSRPRLLALANTTSRRGREVIGQAKYGAAAVLTDTAVRQKKLSLSLGRKLAKLTLDGAEIAGLASPSGRNKLARLENTISRTNNSIEQSGKSIQTYSHNGQKYLASEAGRSLWSLGNLYSKIINRIIPESLKNRYARLYEQPRTIIEKEVVVKEKITIVKEGAVAKVGGQSPVKATQKAIKPQDSIGRSAPSRMTNSNLSITGNADIGGQLNVSGPVSLKNKLTVLGQAEFNADITVAAALTAKSLLVTDYAQFAGPINAKDLTADSLTSRNNLTVVGDSFVGGNELVKGNLKVAGVLQAGHTEFSSLGVTGQLGAKSLSAGTGGLAVSGNTYLAGPVDLNGTLDIDVKSGSALTVGDGSTDYFTVNTTSGGSINIAAALNLSGNTQYSGDMDLNAALDLDTASTSALTVGDGAADNFTIDTVNDILTLGYSSTTDQINVNAKQLALNFASSSAGLLINYDGTGNIIQAVDNGVNRFILADRGNLIQTASTTGYAYVLNQAGTNGSLLDVQDQGTSRFTIADLGVVNLTASSTTGTALTVRQDSSGDILNLFDGDNEVLTVLDGGNLGIGTTTPNWLLQAAGVRPFFTLSDTGAAANQKHWFMSSQSGNFYIGTSSDALATSTISALTINSNGFVGIATTSPAVNFAVGGHCVTGDTRLRRRRKRRNKNGVYEYEYDEVQIKDIKPGDEIASLNEQTGKIVWSKVNGLLDMGIQTTYKLITEDGRQIRTTAEHPYLVKEIANRKLRHQSQIENVGWLKVSDIKEGDYIAAPKPRVGVFIDNANIFYAQKKADFKVDWQKLKNIFSSVFDVSFMNYYLAMPDKSDAAFMPTENYLKHIQGTVNIITKPLKYIQVAKGKYERKGNMDIKIAADVLAAIDNLDAVIIVSGDSDFKDLADSIIVKNKKVIFVGFENNMAWELRQMKHVYLNRIREAVELSENKKAPSFAPGKPSSKLGVLLSSIVYSRQEILSSPDVDNSEIGNDFIWTYVKKIEKVAEEQVYDIEVEGTHNFIGNDIVAHNTYITGGLGAGLVETGAGNITGTGRLSITSTSATSTFSTGGLTVGTSQFVVQQTSGNVGIGTTTPVTKLHVSGGEIQLDNNKSIRFADTGAIGNSANQIYTDTSSKLNLYVAGGTKAVIDTSGNIGIGTTSPVSKLSVVGESAFAGGASVGIGYAGTAAPTGGMIIQGNLGIGTTTPTQILSLYQASADVGISLGNSNKTMWTMGTDYSDGSKFKIASSSALGTNDRLTIDTNGNVGIGTTSPYAKLSVAGRGVFDQDIRFDYFTATSTSATSTIAGGLAIETSGLVYDWQTNNVGIGTAGPGAKLDVNGEMTLRSGRLTITNSVPFSLPGTGADEGIYFNYDATNNKANIAVATVGVGFSPLYLQASEFRFGVGVGSSVEKMVIQNDGNVGIGTTTPNWLLQAAGTRPLFTLSDTGAGANLKHWFMSSQGGNFYVGTSSDALATSTVSALTINANGFVGIATTSPAVNFAVGGHCVTGDTRLRRRRRRKNFKFRNSNFESNSNDLIINEEKENLTQNSDIQNSFKIKNSKFNIDDKYIYDEVQIKDIQPGDEIASLDEKTGKIVWSRVNGLLDMGVKEIYKLTTESGKTIRTTAEHPYLVRQSPETDKVKQQKLFRFEVDQSGKMEELNKRTVVAVANEENSFAVVMGAHEKRALFEIFRQAGAARYFATLSFGSLVALAVRGLEKQGIKARELVIDNEYIGYESRIKRTILAAFKDKDLEISFTSIGKKSAAHFAAYGVFLRKKTADIAVGHNVVLRITKDAPQTLAQLDISQLIHGPQKRQSITHSIAGLKDLSRGDEKKVWTKVFYLKVGQEIAVQSEDKTKAVWDKIVKIEILPAEQVYDIEVEGTHNFIGNDIVAHNTYITGGLGVGTTETTNGNITGTGRLAVQSTTATSTFSTGGLTVGTSQFVVQQTSGNVGIGTTSPWGLLSVNPNGISGPSFTVGSSTKTDFVITNAGNVGIGTTTPSNLLSVYSATAATQGFSGGATKGVWSLGYDVTNNRFAIASSSDITSNVRMVIDNNGNLGIGTTSPYAKLSVAGRGVFDQDIRFDYFTATSTSATSTIAGGLAIETSGLVYDWQTNNVGIGTAAPSSLLHTVGGNIKMEKSSAQLQLLFDVAGNNAWESAAFVARRARGTVASPSAVQTGDDLFVIAGAGYTGSAYGTDAQIIMEADGNYTAASRPTRITLSTHPANNDDNPTERIRIDSTGNVGIGTTSPGSLLSVAGNGLFNGSITAYGGFTGSSITATSSLTISASDTASSSVNNLLTLEHLSSASGGLTGIGGAMLFKAEDTGGSSTSTARILSALSNVSTTSPASYLAFETKNTTGSLTERLRLDSNGNLGIGTTTPSNLLDIYSSTAAIQSFSGGATKGEWSLGYDVTNNRFAIASSTSITSNVRMVIDNAGNVGIGTTSPYATLSVAGRGVFNSDVRFDYFTATSTSATSTLAGGLAIETSGFVYDWQTNNVGIGTAAPGTLLDVNGISSFRTYQQLFNGVTQAGYFGPGVAIFAAGPTGAGDLGIRAVSDFGISTNDATTPQFVIDTTGNVGIGTTSPAKALDVLGDIRSYSSVTRNIFAQTSGTSQYAGFNAQADTALLFSFALGSTYGGTTFGGLTGNNQVGFEAQSASSFWMGTNDTAPLVFGVGRAEKMRITSTGNVGIGTTSPESKFFIEKTVSDTLSVANSALSIFDSTHTAGLFAQQKSSAPYGFALQAGNIGGSSQFPILLNPNGGNVGIGTTSPYARLSVVSGVTDNSDVIAVSTSTTGAIFRVTGYGNVVADGTITGGGADYAEYFYSQYTNLQAGETVCIDLIQTNAVKRCYRGHDNNVMGIVSSKPSILGNSTAAVKNDPAHYVIIGMLGQVDALVSAENGPINIGDSLTSASSTPGYAMRADGGDSTVGVALEPLASGTGKIKVLISRRNKSLAVEEVEALVVERIANMKIEDQVQAMIKQAVDSLNLDPKIAVIAQQEASKLDSTLTVRLDETDNKIFNFQFSIGNEFSKINDQINSLAGSLHITNSQGQAVFYGNRDTEALLNREVAITATSITLNGTTTASNLCLGGICKNVWPDLSDNIKIDESGNIVIGRNPLNPPLQGGQEGAVRIVEITEITVSSSRAAFVVNQAGEGQVADFQASGVSIMNIDNQGQVKIMGSLLVDGRIMLCTGGNCSDALDAAVDETMADLGVEGKVVAGAFEGYCDEGYAWVPGSAKYGTLPGFCVMSDLAGAGAEVRGSTSSLEVEPRQVNVSQGQAQVACQNLGTGYHLLSENEWLTIAENILQVSENNLASSTALKLTNDNIINNLTGSVAEWTNQNVTSAGLPVTPAKDIWHEYGEVVDFKGLNIAPDYYLTDANNHIGKIKIGSGTGLRGFVRGESGIYGLDLSHSPDEQSESIGFRCAK